MAIGIVAYGAYIPYLRLKGEEYKKAWGSNAAGITEKAVAGADEDSLTLAVAAGREALTGQDAGSIACLALGSTSLPYAEKASAGTLAATLGLPARLYTSEHTTSAAAGLEALLAAKNHLASHNGLALALASDTQQAIASDTCEQGLGAAAAALVLGTYNPLAVIEAEEGVTGEFLGERFRLAGEPFLSDPGLREYASANFISLSQQAGQALFASLGLKAADYRYLVAGQPDGRTAQSMGKALGFSDEQVKPGLLYPVTGDTGATSAMLSLCRVLDQAQSGERILLMAYGAGAKAIAVSLQVTDAIAASRPARPLSFWLERKAYLDYAAYLKVRRHIV